MRPRGNWTNVDTVGSFLATLPLPDFLFPFAAFFLSL